MPCGCKRIYGTGGSALYKARYPGVWNSSSTRIWQISPAQAPIDLDAVNERVYFGASTFLKNCDLDGGDIQSSDMGYAGPTANLFAVRAYPSLPGIVYVRNDPGFAAPGQRAIVTADLDDTVGSRSTIYQDGIDAGHPVGATVHYWFTNGTICQDINTGIIYFIRTSSSTAAGRPFSELCSVPSTGGGETVLYSTDSDANFAGTINGQSIEIDYVNNKLWFVNIARTISSTHPDEIVQCNLDGSGYTVMYTAASSSVLVRDIQVNHTDERIYYLVKDPTPDGTYSWNESGSGLRSALLDFTDDRLEKPLSKLYDGGNLARFRLGEHMLDFDDLA